MNDKIVDYQSILEENNRLDSYFQRYSEESDSEIDIFHHRLPNRAYDTHLIASDTLGDDDLEPLDLTEWNS